MQVQINIEFLDGSYKRTTWANSRYTIQFDYEPDNSFYWYVRDNDTKISHAGDEGDMALVNEWFIKIYR